MVLENHRWINKGLIQTLGISLAAIFYVIIGAAFFNNKTKTHLNRFIILVKTCVQL